MEQITVISNVEDAIKYLDNFQKGSIDLEHINVNNKEIRKILHKEAHKRNLRAHTYYEIQDEQTSVRCNNCHKSTSTINAKMPVAILVIQTYRYVECSHCDIGDDKDDYDFKNGRIYYYIDEEYDSDDETGEKKLKTTKTYIPTDHMIIIKVGTSYKHLNTIKGYYRKHY